MDLLEKMALLTPAPSGPAPTQGERNPVLEKFHSIKDKHVFRILGTITHPNHSVSARIRAMNDLPKRVKATAGDAVQKWAVSLVQRCAMGDFLNQDAVHHCIILAHECFQQEDWEAAKRFLTCVEMAASSFAALCSSEEDFGTLFEMFRDCSNISSSSSKKKHLDNANILTLLSSILAMASPHRTISSEPSESEHDIQKQLIKLCRDGTPEQARHSTATMVALLKPKEGHVLTLEQNKAFLPLLQNLASPSNLTVASSGSSTKVICVLVALTELAEHAPKIFETESRGKKALKFALESVLMGRARSKGEEDFSDDSSNDSEDESEDESAKTKTAKGRRGTKSTKSLKVVGHLSPSGNSKSLVDDDNLSVCCRTLCAAIELLTSFIRSNILTNRNTKEVLSQSTQDSIEKLFDVLSIIIRDEGMPPSSRDRKFFSLRQDRAALRQYAAVSLFRLSDTRLGLDKFLTTERWHYLAGMLLDDEKVVRSNVMEELGEMLTGCGKYAAAMGQASMPPRLKFLAFIVLCTDGDHNVDHSAANGNAANVGKHIQNAKGNATNCVEHLRRVYEVAAVQARANGEQAERRFQTSTKLSVMPEYAVPYAFHLLANRRETPRAANSKKNADDEYETDDSGHRILQKRVKMLFEILFKTADGNNVSFLLRMAEIISGKHPKSPSDGSPDGENQGKLLKVCQVSREVLLSLVKRDDNLESFPGEILIPKNLFGSEGRKKRVVALESGPGTDILRVSNHEGNDDEKSVGNQMNDFEGEDGSLPSSTGKDDDTRNSRRTTRSAVTRKSLTSNSSNDSERTGGDSRVASQGKDDESVATRRRSTTSGMKRKSGASYASIKESLSPGQSKRSRPSLDSDRTPNKSVHFSPYKPMEFDCLSPIVKNASPDPTSREPDLTSTSRSPTPISGDSTAREEEVEKRKSVPGRRRTRKLPPSVTGKENASAGRKRKSKKSVPNAIKIVRKPSPKLKETKKTTRESTRKSKAIVDPLDFDG
jgi:hypothetical protein